MAGIVFIVRKRMGIFFAIKVEEDVIHLFADSRVIRQSLIPETRHIPIRQFLPDGSQIGLGIVILPLFPIGKGRTPHGPVLLGHLLLTQVICL